MKLSAIIFFSIFLAVSCNQEDYTIDMSDQVGEAGGETGVGSVDIGFLGATSISSKTDVSVTISWTPHPGAVAYEVYNTTSSPIVWLSTIFGQASNSYTISNLTPGQTYKFRVRAKVSSGMLDTNTNDLSVTTNLAPNAPSALAMLLPAASSGTSATPTVMVSGIRSGVTVKVYTNNTCTTLVGTQIASGTSENVVLSTLPSLGTYNLYATATNSQGNTSACSTSSVSYQLISSICPNGYALVPGDSDLGTSDFCVMRYEAKNNSGPVSQASGDPWVSINILDAKQKCLDLDQINDKYDLISNEEWMTIARNVEGVSGNFSSGIMARGHTANSSTNPVYAPNDSWTNTMFATSTDSSSVYNSDIDLFNSTGIHTYRRTLTLSNGEIIWDFSGNVWEWVDWERNTGFQYPPLCNFSTWTDFLNVIGNSCGLMDDDFLPSTYDSNSYQGFGKFVAKNWPYTVARRGGHWNSSSIGGAFALGLDLDHDDVNATVGFRCVYRP